ncbi:PLATZ transcription factor family protein [Tanacetum coccineum]
MGLIVYYRRYVYHDVLRVNDAEKLMDCSNIQSNFTNGAYVVFLNQRPQTRCKALKNCCIWCRRGVQESNFYCSIFCKIKHVISEGLLSKCVYECEELNMPEQDGLMTPDSILEPFVPIRTSSSSSASYGFIDCRTLACTATSEIVRKKRTSNPRPKIREVTAYWNDMSEVFEGYERRYCELSVGLSKKCTSASLLGGGMKDIAKAERYVIAQGIIYEVVEEIKSRVEAKSRKTNVLAEAYQRAKATAAKGGTNTHDMLESRSRIRMLYDRKYVSLLGTHTLRHEEYVY